MTTKLIAVILVASLVMFEDVHTLPGFHKKHKYDMSHALFAEPGTPLPPDQWFTQLLDHSNPAISQTWQQRYQVVTNYYQEGGPVFLMLGGESEASPVWLVKGNWVNYAKEYKALMFQLEHRFYGNSHPTSNLSVDNLRFLTSEQALSDAAYFVEGMTKVYNLTSDNNWIVFGGSYAGNLAAWMRYKYPHLVKGAVSSSGPVLAQTDFPEYMEVVRNSLLTFGEDCIEAIQTANRLINRNLKKKKGQKMLFTKFRLCDPIDATNKNDVQNLLESMADNIAGIVQYNKDNRSFRSVTWNITIDIVCNMMTDSSRGNPLDRYAALNSMFLDVYQENCLDYKYDKMINTLKDPSWEGVGGSSGARQWTYQTCTEFGYYQTSENKRALFGEEFALPFFIKQCSDIFGEGFTKDVVDAGVYRTNLLYGGLDIAATNVVYVHGTIDPWHALGITRTRIPSSPAILINGTAHCANMYPPATTDIPELQKARQFIGDLIGEWI